MAETKESTNRFSFADLFIGLCGVSFVATVLPCFLKLASTEAACFNTVVFETFSLTALVGGLVGGLLSFSVVSFEYQAGNGKFAVASVGSLLYLIGYGMAFAFGGEVMPLIGGVLFGMGAVLLCAVWVSCMSLRDFSHVVSKGSLVVFAAVLIDQVVFVLAGQAAVIASMILLVLGIAPPLRIAWKNRAEKTSSHPSGDAVGEYDGLFAAKPSVKEIIKALSSSMMGLVVFAAYSNAINDPFPGVGVSGTSFGLVIASLVIFLVLRFGGRRITAPFIYWVLFPAIAALLVILDSFPINSPAFMVGATGITVFCSGLGLFAFGFLLIAGSENRVPFPRSIGLTFAVFSFAGLVGRALRYSGFTSDEIGSILLVLSTAYMVYLLFAPAAQLWKSRKASPERADESMPEVDDLANVCERVSKRYGLSPREEEVLVYVGQGYNSPYIAKALFISDSTVRSHLKSIYRKTEASSRMDLVDLIRRENASAR